VLKSNVRHQSFASCPQHVRLRGILGSAEGTGRADEGRALSEHILKADIGRVALVDGSERDCAGKFSQRGVSDLMILITVSGTDTDPADHLSFDNNG
jgi:hypothetical protein